MDVKMAVRLAITTLYVLLAVLCTESQKNDFCVLPDCYNTPTKIPGNLPKHKVPQMVLFTYTGIITETEEKALREVFTSYYKNPNNCPVGITVFVNGEKKSDMCSVHRLYARGFEIASNGYNNTNPFDKTGTEWNITRWRQQIADHRETLSLRAYIPIDEISGMRAPSYRAGKNVMFDMLLQEGFVYDSTLSYGQVTQASGRRQVWPFTFTNTSFCEVGSGCPDKPYPFMWEVPVQHLQVKSSSGGVKLCKLLTQCVGPSNTIDEIHDVIMSNFDRCFLDNKAPLQINLRSEALASERVTSALKTVLDDLTTRDDVWIITSQQAIAWTQDPTTIDNLEFFPEWWDCSKRKFAKKCGSRREDTDWNPTVFAEVLDVTNIHIWTIVGLIVAYLIVLWYDRSLSDD